MLSDVHAVLYAYMLLLFIFLHSCVSWINVCSNFSGRDVAVALIFLTHLTFLIDSQPCMHEFTPLHKHNILTHYRAGVRGAGFKALARRFAVKGGDKSLRQWHQRWDGTPASLQEQPRSGRPRILSRAEVSRHVRAPLLAANRAHRAIHYTTLLPSVKAKTGKELSVQTLRRIGKEELGAKQKRSKKRTAAESESTEAHDSEQASLPVEHAS